MSLAFFGGGGGGEHHEGRAQCASTRWWGAACPSPGAAAHPLIIGVQLGDLILQHGDVIYVYIVK